MKDKINNWLDGPIDLETKEEIRRMMREDPARLSDGFFKDLSFGTGGLRALMGVGTNRLNLYTIRLATQGLANYLKKQPRAESGLSVFIGYDVRHLSKEFAEESARVMAGNQIRVFITETICPTPLVSFGCRHFGCQAAIMITASHNPPEYNGYKVYWSDGGQIVPPHDLGIIEEVRKVVDLNQVLLGSKDSPLIEKVGSDLDELYLFQLSKLRLHQELPPLKILYTPLHGTGIRIIPRALKSWGFTCRLVDGQKDPDGNFTNAPSPNPEEAKALQMGSELLENEGGDLLIATDPDADRVGIAVLEKGRAIRLTGNQIASVSLYHICEALKGKMPANGAFVKTIVTTELFKKIAENYGALCFDVLTGFKYIAELIALWEKSAEGPRYIYGGEESYGYLFGTFVRDKDAISSSCLIAEAAAFAKKENLTLIGKLYQLYEKYGVHRESLTTLSFPDSQAGMDAIDRLMGSLRKNPPLTIGSRSIKSFDDFFSKGSSPLPPSNVLRFMLEDGSKLIIRPSGTEPKIKIYAEVSKRGNNIEETIQECDENLTDLVNDFKRGYCEL